MPGQLAVEYAIYPGRGVGDFTLGQKISEAIAIIRASNPPPLLEVRYPEEDTANGILLVLPEHQIELQFEKRSQCLVAVSLNDPEHTTMMQNGATLSSSSLVPTFAGIYRLLGPTFPGKLQDQDYLLSYPGITFVFKIPKQFTALYNAREELPLEFPDGTTPVASSVQVHCIKDPSDLCAHHELVAMLTEGTVRLDSLCLQLGASPQEVQQMLGEPCAVCHKPNSDEYLYNYFALGLDLVFNSSHSLIKFVFHCNQPGHRDFNIYDKCHFSMLIDKAGEQVISCESTFGQAEATLGESLGGQPVLNSAPASNNPFKATKFYGWQPTGSYGLILEITNAGEIASASMFVPCP